MTQDEADESEPAFSPDGSRIVFRSEKGIGGVYIVSSLGGEVRKVVDRGRAPGFSPDGQWLSYWEGRVTGLGGASGGLFAKSYIVPVAGGEPRELAPGFGAFYPVWSPDGKRILFVGTDPSGASDWWVMPLGGAPLRTGLAELLHSHRITQFARPAQWTEKNYVLFSSGFGDTRNIWRVSLSAGTWRATGDPERLSAGTTLEVQPAIAGNHVAVASIAENVEVWALPVDTNAARVTGDPQQLTHDLALDASPALSADGRKMAFVSARSGHTQVWFKDLTTGKEMALTATPGDKNRPQISPDGSQIIYGVTESGDGYVISSSGGIPRKACEHCGMIRNWSSDAKRILLEPGVEGRPVIALLGLDAGGRVELLRHPRQGLYSARFSPDDRWLAFAIPTAGICRLYVAPVRPSAPSQPDEWIPITDPEGWSDKPGWSPDGNTLYFLSERDGFRCLWAQKLDSGSKRPIAAPFPVYHSHSARRSVMNVPLEYLEISVARDKIAFNMGERTGNIWLATADAVK